MISLLNLTIFATQCECDIDMIVFVIICFTLLCVSYIALFFLAEKLISHLCTKNNITNSGFTFVTYFRSNVFVEVRGVDIHANILEKISCVCQKFVPLSLTTLRAQSIVVQLSLSKVELIISPCVHHY